MTFSTAFRISGVCLLGLAAEALAAYFLFSNYAYELADTGEYTVQEAYANGPVGPTVTMFYGLLVVTAVAAVIPPLIALGTKLLGRHHRAEPGAGETSGPLPPPRPPD